MIKGYPNTVIKNLYGEDVTEEIVSIVEKFLKNTFKNISSLNLQKLNLNPYLIKILGEVLELNSGIEIITYLINNRLERSTVTSFGNILQDIAKTFSEGTGVEGADISIKKGGIRYYIQVKSGPNTVNKDICRQISRDLISATRRDPGSVGLLGICYGNRKDVSSVANNYLDINYIIGKEFWEFISGDPECYKKIYKLAGHIAEKYEDKGGITLKELIHKKIRLLSEEFSNNYGKYGDEMWSDLLKDNM